MSASEVSPKLTYKPTRKIETFYTGGAVRVARDGKALACACGDEVKVVDVETGGVTRTLPGDSEPITALAVSPDCRTLVAASRSLACRQWDFTTGDCLRTWRPHKAPVADIAIDASGGYCATAGADRAVKVWDLQAGYATHSFLGHSGVVLRVLFHPKHLQLYSCGDDGEVRVWDLVERSCTAVLKAHFSAVTALALSPDGWLLLSAGRDKVVVVWDLRTNARVGTVPVFEALEGLAALPLGLPFPGVAGVDPGSLLKGAKKAVFFATAGEKGLVKVWRSDTCTCLYTIDRAAMGGALAAPGGGGLDGQAAGGGQEAATAPPGSELMDLALLPGGRGLLAATGDARLLFLVPHLQQQPADAPGGKKALKGLAAPSDKAAAAKATLRAEKQLVGHLDEVTDLAFLGPPGAPTGLAVATNSDALQVFALPGMGALGALLGHREAVLALDGAHLSDGRDLLVSGSKDNDVRVWDAARGTCLALGGGHVGAVGAVALARKAPGAFAVTGGADKLLKLWDLAPLLAADWASVTGPRKLATLAATAAHDKDINAVAVAPSDALAASASQDRTVKLWKLPALALVATLRGHRRGVWGVQFSPVDQVVVTSSGDKTVKMWGVRDGACLRTFEGHTASVLRASFVTAGTQVLSVGADGLLKLWAVRTGECLNTFDEHQDRIWALAAAGANESMLATGGADASVTVWEDTTKADAEEAAEREVLLAEQEQELENALVDEDFAAAARLAFELKHPGRLLAVLQRAGAAGDQAQRLLEGLVRHMPGEELRTALEYCREWNTNAKHCHVAQAMLRAILAAVPPQQLLAVKGIRELVDGLLAYSGRHMARMDRLLRASFLLDLTLSAAGVLLPEGSGGDQVARQRPALTNGVGPPAPRMNGVGKHGAAGRGGGGGGGDDLGSDDFVAGSSGSGSESSEEEEAEEEEGEEGISGSQDEEGGAGGWANGLAASDEDDWAAGSGSSGGEEEAGSGSEQGLPGWGGGDIEQGGSGSSSGDASSSGDGGGGGAGGRVAAGAARQRPAGGNGAPARRRAQPAAAASRAKAAAGKAAGGAAGSRLRATRATRQAAAASAPTRQGKAAAGKAAARKAAAKQPGDEQPRKRSAGGSGAGGSSKAVKRTKKQA